MTFESGHICPIIEAELNAYNLRVTQPRERALAALRAQGNTHFTAAQLETWADLTTATAYNCLAVFTDKGLVRVIPRGHNQAAIYDTDTTSHSHFINENGEISDAPMPEITIDPAAIPDSYQVTGIEITIRTRAKNITN